MTSTVSCDTASAGSGKRALSARVLAGLILAAPLPGCTLGPSPAAPILPSPATRWNAGSDTAEWPTARWWTAFASPELDQLIAEAESRNLDLVAARARLGQADAQARIAGAPLLPTLSAAPVVDETQRVAASGRLQRFGTLGGTVTASYQIDIWGRNRDILRSARESTRAAAYDGAVTRITIIAGVAATYFNLLATQDQLALAKAQLADANALLEGYRVQLQHGLIAGLQVEQQRAFAEQLAAGIPAIEAQRTHLADALAVLTARNPEGFSVTGGSLADLAVPPIVAGIPSGLLAHRPDIREAEHDLAAAGADIQAARKSFLPTFGLSASGGAESVALSSAVTSPTGIFDIGLSVLQPIFAGGRLRGQVDLSNERYRELAAAYLKAIHQAYGDVEDALASTGAAREQLARQDAATASAQRAVMMAKAGYRAGMTDALPLLLSQQTLSGAQAQQVQARLGQVLSLVGLYKALGGGWSVTESPGNADTRDPG